MIDTAGEPMRAAIAPWLDIECRGLERFEALLFPAIEQALEPLAAAGDALFASLWRSGFRLRGPGCLQISVLRCAPVSPRAIPVDSSLRRCSRAVMPPALLGLYASLRKMAEGVFDACVVAGVESYLDPETLEWLEENDQLHGAGRLNNAWGFVPGEAAGAALLVDRARVGAASD